MVASSWLGVISGRWLLKLIFYCLEDIYFLNTAIRYYLKLFEEIKEINKYIKKKKNVENIMTYLLKTPIGNYCNMNEKHKTLWSALKKKLEFQHVQRTSSQLPHFACPGQLLACLSWWFSYQMTCPYPCPSSEVKMLFF